MRSYLLSFAVWLVSFTDPAQAAVKANSCSILAQRLPKKVSFPSDEAYTQSISSYFSQQEQALKPNCVVKPESAKDVALALKVLTKIARSPFAVRGGGHTPWAGSANIDKGVTIDLGNLKSLDLDHSQNKISVGAGARWGDIYEKLDPLNLAVVGGRASQVGVAGLTLGGGISYLSPRYGFVCDNVLNFEIVLASGNIINARQGENLDLYRALKGGSNNFGIVTRFDFKTVPLAKMWGGQIVYPITQAPKALQAFAKFADMKPYDEYATTIQSVAYVDGFGAVGVNDFEYTKAMSNPPVFNQWKDVQPRLQSSLRLAKLKNITDEQGSFSPNGLREIYDTLTVRNDPDFLQYIFKTWQSTLNSSITTISGINYALVFQPITSAITSKSPRSGGNSLGLSPSQSPLVLLQTSIQWSNIADDELLTAVSRNLLANIDKEARRRGLSSDYLYLNYATKGQNPIAGYGVDNVRQLQAVSCKYDPEGVFQRQVPGGFKLRS